MVEYLLVLPIIYAFWLLAVYLMQDRLMFPRDLVGAAPNLVPREVEPLWIEIGSPEDQGKVEAWLWRPAASVDGEEPGRAPLVIYFHGNAELIDDCRDRLRGWHERGYAVLLPEYRGYGRSDGAPSQKGIVADAQRFYDLVAARPDIDPARIVIQGRSIGGGVACQLAASRLCAALILECPFTSAASFAWRVGAPPFLCTSPFRNDAVLRTLDRPVLILHAAQDEIIPVSHGRRLHALARQSTYAELDGGHNTFPLDESAYWDAIDRFLHEHGLPNRRDAR